MTAAADGAVLEQRLANLQRELTGYSGLLVAFSGGADSAFLLAAAVRASGEVLAATSTSESLASGEWAAAARFAGLNSKCSRSCSRVADKNGEMTDTTAWVGAFSHALRLKSSDSFARS